MLVHKMLVQKMFLASVYRYEIPIPFFVYLVML